MPSKSNSKAKSNAGKCAKPLSQGAGKSVATMDEVEKSQWPLLRPLVPVSDLRLDVVLEGQIVLIHKFFTFTLCQQYVSFLASLPLTTTPGEPKKGNALRVNDRFAVEDAGFARQLWETTSLREMVVQSDINWGGSVCGLNPKIRIYRYRQGHFFDQHYDESNLIMLPGQPPVSARTTWTLLIYLTASATGCMGGETVFYPEEGSAKGTSKKTNTGHQPIIVVPEVGLALLHKHGNNCLLHEGKIVEAGEKWVIRSDLCVTR